MRVTNRYLKNHYAEINRKFFSNKLPKDMVVVFASMERSTLGSCSIRYGRPLYIELNRRLAWNHMLVEITLLHECVHVENPQYAGHGPWFQKRMLQLAKLGAFKHVW